MAKHSPMFKHKTRCVFHFSFYKGWCEAGILPETDFVFVCKFHDCKKSLHFMFAVLETFPCLMRWSMQMQIILLVAQCLKEQRLGLTGWINYIPKFVKEFVV